MRTDTIIIGGGQAGLAMGYHLARRGTRFVILDAAPRVGQSWSSRWDSLTLFTPAAYSGLPGMAFPGDPGRYPGKDEVADYLTAYAARFRLPVQARERVHALRAGTAGWEAETRSGRYEAAQVVVATGPFHEPVIPRLSRDLPPGVVQLHSASYRNPAQLPARDVLVVGAGNSGVQIAEELSRTHRVHLAAGERMPRLPQQVLGRSLFWWLERAGLMNVSVESLLGRRMSRTDTLIGKSPRMLDGVRVLGRAVEGAGQRRAHRGWGPCLPSLGGVGDRLPSRLRVDRGPGARRARRPRAPTRCDIDARAVLPRIVVAAYARIRAAGLGRPRRGVHRRDRRR